MSIDVERLSGRRADNRWDRVCVTDLVERVTWSRPDHPAIVALPGAASEARFSEMTYRQLDELTNQIANALITRGLGHGDVVLSVCENSVEAYAMKLGAAKAGTTIAPLNPSLATDVIADIIARIEPAMAVVDAELVEHAEAAFKGSDVHVDVTIGIGGPVAAGSMSFADFVDGHPTDEPDVVIHGDDIWEILFTSGTTSMPKAAMLSHVSSTMTAHGFALSITRGLEFESDLVCGTLLPMIYHVGHACFVLSTFAAGGTVVIGRRPDATIAASAVAEYRLTALWAGSPAMVTAMDAVVDAQQIDISSLTVVIYGWGAVPPAVYDRLRTTAPGLRLMGIFGQTEAIACHRFWPSAHDELYRDTAPATNYVGLPSPLLAGKIIDAEGRSLVGKAGVPGESVYRTPTLTAGYYRDEQATRIAFHGGWFHSGDSCRYDDHGLRVMVDRFKDIVKTGGENVSSLRVEAVVVSHPAIEKVAVIGVPDDRWGEAVTAIVVPIEGATIDEAEIIAFARERLAGFETPKSVIVTDALPETIGGKILKYKLRQYFTRSSDLRDDPSDPNPAEVRR